MGCQASFSPDSLDDMARVSCRKVLTLEKEENQTFGFEIQVGEAGCRGSEGLRGQSEGWMDPAPPLAEEPPVCCRLTAFTTERSSVWRW